MNFLESFFDIGERKRRKHGEPWEQSDNHHDHRGCEEFDNEDHDDHHDDDHHNYQGVTPRPYQPNQGVQSLELFCPQCSSSLVPGARFFYQCGKAIESNTKCASCGSQLLNGATFCPYCGYKNV